MCPLSAEPIYQPVRQKSAEHMDKRMSSKNKLISSHSSEGTSDDISALPRQASFTSVRSDYLGDEVLSWPELCEIVETSQLHRLRRQKNDLSRYMTWRNAISAKYGSVQAYVLDEVLQWASPTASAVVPQRPHFRADQPKHTWEIRMNDWPYAIPHDCVHIVVWSKYPILSEHLIPQSAFTRPHIRHRAKERMLSRGLSGTIWLECMGEAHAEELGSGESDEEQRILFAASHEIRSFCLQRLPRSEFQALAFFANPPSLQSVPELPHFHVIGRRKAADRTNDASQTYKRPAQLDAA